MNNFPKRNILLNIIVSLSFFFTSYVIANDDLNSVVKQVLENNSRLNNAKYSIVASKESTKAAQAGYYPNINLSLSEGRSVTKTPGIAKTYNSDGNAGFSLSQTLLNPALTIQVQQNKVQEELTLANFNKEQENIIFETINVYINVLRYRELISISDKSFKTNVFLSKSLVTPRKNEKEFNLFLAESKTFLAKSELEQSQSNLHSTELNYKHLVKVKPKPNLEKLDIFNHLPNTLDSAKKIATEYNKDLIISKIQLATSTNAIKMAKTSFSPTLSLDAQTSYSDSGNPFVSTHSSSVSINFNIPIFAGGMNVHNLKSAAANAMSAKYSMMDTKDKIIQNLEQQWSSFISTKKYLDTLKIHSYNEEKMWHKIINNIKNNNIKNNDTWNIYNQHDEYIAAKIKYINTFYEYILNSYKLASTIGILSNNFEL